MLRRLRLRPLGVVVVAGTVAAIAAALVTAAPGGAAIAKKEYAASFEPQCVIAPGVFNLRAVLSVGVRAMAPEQVGEGEAFELTEASSSITSPKQLTEAFVTIGVHEVRGFVTDFTLDSTNLAPPQINLAKPAEFPTGLPFFAPVVKEHSVTFSAPSEMLGETGRSFSFGPIRATGKAGEVVKATVDPSVGFEEEAENGYKATGVGIVAEIEGFSEAGSHSIGPLPVVCTAPRNVVVAEIPIVEGAVAEIPPGEGTTTTTSTTTTSPTTTTTVPTTTTTTTVPTTTTTSPTTTTTTSATTTTTSPTTTTTSTTTTTTTKSTTTTTTTSHAAEVKFENWQLSGSLSVKMLKESINLPEGCTFNGHALDPGELEGNTLCPPFSTRIRLLSMLPTTLGVTFTESEPVHGTVTAGTKAGDVTFKATSKQNIGITFVQLLGIKVPTNCQTQKPVVFPLELEAPASDLTTGATFTGETTLPNIKCHGGLLGLGGLLGDVVSGVMSGPGNRFTLTIKPK